MMLLLTEGSDFDISKKEVSTHKSIIHRITGVERFPEIRGTFPAHSLQQVALVGIQAGVQYLQILRLHNPWSACAVSL